MPKTISTLHFNDCWSCRDEILKVFNDAKVTSQNCCIWKNLVKILVNNESGRLLEHTWRRKFKAARKLVDVFFDRKSKAQNSLLIVVGPRKQNPQVYIFGRQNQTNHKCKG